MRTSFLLCVAAALSAGCHSSGSTGGSNVSVSGTVGGQLLSFVDVGSYASQGADLQGGISFAEVFLTSRPFACGWFDGENASKESLSTLSILVQSNGAPPLAPFAAGTYAIGNTFDRDAGTSVSAQAQVIVTDATCGTAFQCGAASGSVTFTSIAADTIAGTFDVTFQSCSTPDGGSTSMDHLTGTFSAPVCKTIALGTEAGACHP